MRVRSATAVALLFFAEGARTAEGGRRGAGEAPGTWTVAQEERPTAGSPDQAAGRAAPAPEGPPSQEPSGEAPSAGAQSGEAQAQEAPPAAGQAAPPSAPNEAPAPERPARGAPSGEAAAPPEKPPEKQPAKPAAPKAQPGPAVSGADISKSKISGTDISGATISGGTISGGKISNSEISGGTITGGKISDSEISGGGGKPQGKSSGKRGSAQQGSDGSPDQARRSGGGAGSSAGSGGGDDDDEAAARALQRSLVQRGALLLPVWGAEIVPGFLYGHTGVDGVTTVVPQPGAPPVTVGVRRRTHQLTSSLTARLGLPWELQVEGTLPFAGAVSDQALAGAARADAKGIGIGDPRLTLTWQVLRAHRMVPDLLVAATWKPQVGRSPYDAEPGKLGLGTGYTSVGGSITASKAADPLVFIATASYTANLSVLTKQGWRDPGDTFGLGGGAILAVSPDTSMSFLLDTHLKPEDHLGGKGLLGTDETVAVLQLGIATVLSRRALLNITVGIGLTADSPNFQIGFTVPFRF